MIKIEPIAAFSDNYIWCLYDDQSRRAVIVDPGDAGPVSSALQARNLSLAAIFITHHHFDHTGGIDGLLAEWGSSIPVYGPLNDSIDQITQQLEDGDRFSFLDLEFSVLTVPGHTLDHIALFCDTADCGPFVFCGDTLFAGGCGRLFEGNPPMMLESLAKLAQLPPDTRAYCAHEYTMANLSFASAVEPDNQALQQRVLDDGQRRSEGLPTVPSTIAMERLTNPFLRSDQAAVIQAAQAHSGESCADEAQVFAVIRGWKDNF